MLKSLCDSFYGRHGAAWALLLVLVALFVPALVAPTATCCT
jgi:hypothetical protein